MLACGTQLFFCTTLVLAYPSVQFVRGILSTRPSGPLMDTDHLLDWPELDVPVGRDEHTGARDEKSFGDTPVDYVLRTARRHTLRRHRVAVEVAIRVNRAAVERQRRAVAADAPSGRTPPVLATLDVAALVSGGASGGIDVTPLGRENGVWCDCRVGQEVVGVSGEGLGGHPLDGGALRVGDVGGISNKAMSAAHYRFACGDGRLGADDILGRICEDRARTGSSDVGGIGRQPPSKLRRLSSHGRRARDQGVESGTVRPAGETFSRWDTDVGARSLSSLSPPGSVRVTSLSAEEQLPTHTYYVPTRFSWRRVEEDPGRRFVPDVRAMSGPFAESARAALMDKWAGRVDSDASDASDDEDCEQRGVHYHRLPQRMRRLAERAGVSAVTGMFGHGAVVLGAIAAAQGCSTAAVRLLVALIERRARDHAALRSERAASIARRTAVKRLTGGASLAVVLGSGAVRVPSMTANGRLVAAGLGRVEARPERWEVSRVAAEATADGVAAGLPSSES